MFVFVNDDIDIHTFGKALYYKVDVFKCQLADNRDSTTCPGLILFARHS